MSAIASSRAPRLVIPVEALRQWTLWLLLAVSAFAALEPSPYEFMFFVALVVFAGGGLRFDKAMIPLILTLFTYDAAGLAALAPYTDQSESVGFIGIGIYVSLTSVFFAAAVAGAPMQRMAVLRSGYTMAGLIAAVLGILGYFNVAGLGPYFTLYDNARAMGPFKDPNVFGPFLVPPIVWLVQDVLQGTGPVVRSSYKILVLLLAVLLSFSRGAMLDFAASFALLLGLTYFTSASSKLRSRTLAVAILGVALLVAMLMIMLAIPQIRDTALERISLVQDYDAGEEGRFGNQLRSIPLLLDRPFGFGPFRFKYFFPADPHEVFLSAFASCGWLGGLGFMAFIGATIYLGWALSFRRSSWRTEIIGLWSALLPQILQGVQIDTIHWRHLFMMCGCLYGLAAAVRGEASRRPQRRASV